MENEHPSEGSNPPKLSWAGPLLFLGLSIGTTQLALYLQAELSWAIIFSTLLGSAFSLFIPICGGGLLGIFATAIFKPVEEKKRGQVMAACLFAFCIIGVGGYQARVDLLSGLLKWRLPYFDVWCGVQALIAAGGAWQWRQAGGEIDGFASTRAYSDAGTWVGYVRPTVIFGCYLPVFFAVLELWQSPKTAALAGGLLLLGLAIHAYAHQLLKRIGARDHINVRAVTDPPQLQVSGGSAGLFHIDRDDIAWIQHRHWEFLQSPHETRRRYHCLDVLCHDGSHLTLQNTNANWGHQLSRTAISLSSSLNLPQRSVFQNGLEWTGTPDYNSISRVPKRTHDALAKGSLSITDNDGKISLHHQPKLTPAGRSELLLRPLVNVLFWAALISGLHAWLPTQYEPDLSQKIWLGTLLLTTIGLGRHITKLWKRLVLPVQWALTAQGLQGNSAAREPIINRADITQIQIIADVPNRTASLQVRSASQRIRLFDIKGDLVTTPFAALWAARAALLRQLSKSHSAG